MTEQTQGQTQGHTEEQPLRMTRPGGQFLEIAPDGWMRVRFGMVALRARKVNLRALVSAKEAHDATSTMRYAVLEDSDGNRARFPLTWFEHGHPEVARVLADAVSGVRPDGDGLYGTLVNDADLAEGRPLYGSTGGVPSSPDDPRTTDFLTQRLGRPPTQEELADFAAHMREHRR